MLQKRRGEGILARRTVPRYSDISGIGWSCKKSAMSSLKVSDMCMLEGVSHVALRASIDCIWHYHGSRRRRYN